jgi:hypothetical protein
VQIFAGTKPEGKPIAEAKRVGTTWTSANAAASLKHGTYTAQASSTDAASNAGTSAPATFIVNTAPPTVTLNAPAPRTNVTASAFSGEASDSTAVTVNVYAGETATGTPVSTATTPPLGVGGPWTAGAVSPPLKDGRYTATATQTSSLGNAAGVSAPVSFTVDTTAPSVHISTPVSEVKVSRPTFSGSAGTAFGDQQSVALKIYTGPTATGTPAQTLVITPSSGKWTTGSTGPQLPDGTYTAVAEQADDVGNIGVSPPSTFKVKTNSPEVTLNGAFTHRGEKLFANATPGFGGTAGTTAEDDKTVTLNVYAGTSTSGTPLRTVASPLSGSSWATGPLAPLAEGVYTVQAEQQDFGLNAVAGHSASATFTVDATAPKVAVNSPVSGSSTSGGSQLVRGSTGTVQGDLQSVTVQLFAGPTIGAGSSPLQSIAVTAAAGEWSATFGGLAPGAYALRALQSDDVGNVGTSATSTFSVSAPPTAAAQAGGPTASFNWFPPAPRVGESVALASSSTDPFSPITAFAWDTTGTGAFATGGPGMSTTFTTVGNHVVHLRVTDANGQSSVAAAAIPVGPPALPLLQPFPIVRITSTGTRSGVRLRQLSVLASRGAKITVQCRSRKCPVKAQSHVASASRSRSAFVEFRRFERSLAAGVILEIRVTKPGATGKFTRFLVRRGKVPVRSDACLDGLAIRPVICPSS